MTIPTDDDQCHNMVSQSFVAFYASITGATGLLFGAIFFYIAIVAGCFGVGITARYQGMSRRLSRPLLHEDGDETEPLDQKEIVNPVAGV